MNTPDSDFDRDLGPDADNYLQDLTPRQGSEVMIEYFYGGEDDDENNAKGENTK